MKRSRQTIAQRRVLARIGADLDSMSMKQLRRLYAERQARWERTHTRNDERRRNAVSFAIMARCRPAMLGGAAR